MGVVRQLDLVVLALALPLFLLADLPLVGYAAGGGAWVVQKTIQLLLARRASASDDPRVVVGLTVGGMIGRGWLAALTIFAAGFSSNAAGLAAAVLVIVLFTIYFTVTMILKPFETPRKPAP